MPSNLPKSSIGYINIRVFVHATEDPELVITAVRNILPLELRESAVFKKTQLTGHHGNQIALVETELTERPKLMTVLENIGENFTSLDKETLNSEFQLHLEKGNLYLRFDKQQAFLGQFRFSSNDPIHLQIHFRNKTPNEIVDICREAGLLP